MSIRIVLTQPPLSSLSSLQPCTRHCSTISLSLTVPFTLSQTRGPTAEATEDIITVLLNTMVSDPESAVRLAVLRCLTSDFDIYLGRSHHVEAGK